MIPSDMSRLLTGPDLIDLDSPFAKNVQYEVWIRRHVQLGTVN